MNTVQARGFISSFSHVFYSVMLLLFLPFFLFIIIALSTSALNTTKVFFSRPITFWFFSLCLLHLGTNKETWKAFFCLLPTPSTSLALPYTYSCLSLSLSLLFFCSPRLPLLFYMSDATIIKKTNQEEEGQ